MKTAFNPYLAVAALACAIVVNSLHAQPLVLTGTSYSQDFDEVGIALPDGWTVRTGASASDLGSVASFSSAHKNWTTTTGSFANYASVVSNDSTNFLGNESFETQTNALDRAAGVRQTGAFGDPGAAFVLRIQDTLGFGGFEVSLDFQNLSPQGRTTVWTLDYGIGNTPTSFTPLGTYTNWGTNTIFGVFGRTNQTFSFGTALNNQPENVWIRIAALSPTTGTQSRGTFAIDNFSLSWSNVSITTEPPQITSQPQSRTNEVGTTAAFTVGAIGTAPLIYQWKKGETDVFDGPTPDGSTISGSSTATLTISSVRTNDAGNYSVRIHNSAGETNSEAATLTVVAVAPVVTNIAYLRTLMDPVDYTPTDTTTLFTAEGVVTTPVNLTTSGNAQFYMQDATAGIVVFVLGGSSIRPAQGDLVRVTGPLGQFNGLFELNLNAATFTHSVEILSSGNPVPAPIPLDLATLSNFPVMESSIEGSLVIVSNVFLQGAGGNFASGANYHATNLLGQVALQFVRIDTRALDVIGQPIPEFAASIKGVMGQFTSGPPFTGGYQLFLTQPGDLIAGTPPVPAVELTIVRDGHSVTLSWPDAAYSLQGAPAVTGTYTNIPGANSPYPVQTVGDGGYFRLIKEEILNQ
ncbi:MAG TPA: immunoglobulin domain-containing protein [Verrucomicrobiota bacterium]|nr:immunoglobulin domain-containing protein [Verrucomicrobiota bacterium]